MDASFDSLRDDNRPTGHRGSVLPAANYNLSSDRYEHDAPAPGRKSQRAVGDESDLHAIGHDTLAIKRGCSAAPHLWIAWP